MRKDLWIGATTAMVVHSGIILFSLLRPLPPLHRAGPADATVFLAPVAPPPPVEEEIENTEEVPPKAEQLAPPSIQDNLTPSITSTFVEPVRPMPPTGDPHAIVIPIGYVGPLHSNGPIFDLKDLSQVPVPTSTPNPQYPFEPRRAGIEGTVVVDFIVDEHGAVLRPYAVEGAQADFGQAAVAGVSRWHFRPGMKDGRPVITHMQIPIQFNLQK